MLRSFLIAVTVFGFSTAAAVAQEQSEPPHENERELSTRRAPEKVTLRGAVLVSGVAGPSASEAGLAPASPLVAAAARARSERAKVQITNEDLSRPGGKIMGVTGGTAAADVKMPEDTSQLIQQHDRAMEQWERNMRQTAQTVVTLQQEVRELRAVAGTHEERVGSEEDPARMEAIEASRGEVLNRLETTQEQLEQERKRLEEMKTDPPRIR